MSVSKEHDFICFEAVVSIWHDQHWLVRKSLTKLENVGFFSFFQKHCYFHNWPFHLPVTSYKVSKFHKYMKLMKCCLCKRMREYEHHPLPPTPNKNNCEWKNNHKQPDPHTGDETYCVLKYIQKLHSVKSEKGLGGICWYFCMYCND